MSNRVCHFKLVLLGDTAVGKSCLVVRFVRDEFFEFQEPTIGGKRLGCLMLPFVLDTHDPGVSVVFCWLRGMISTYGHATLPILDLFFFTNEGTHITTTTMTPNERSLSCMHVSSDNAMYHPLDTVL
jgi:hypothetical protein